MSVQFTMSSAPRNGSRTRYKTKLHLNFSTEPVASVTPTPVSKDGIGGFLLKPPTVLQMPLYVPPAPLPPPPPSSQKYNTPDTKETTHWTNVEKVNNELFRLFFFRGNTTDEENTEETMNIDTSSTMKTHSLSFELKIDKKEKIQRIQKLKIREPVQQSNWVFDYFEEAYCNENIEKKKKIQKLKIREPVKQSCWTSLTDISVSSVDEYYI